MIMNLTSWNLMVKKILRHYSLRVIILVFSIILVSIATSIIHADIVKRMVDTVIEVNQQALLQVLLFLLIVTIGASILKVLITKSTFFFKKKLTFILEDQGIAHIYKIQTLPTLKKDEIMTLIQNSIQRVVHGFLTTINDCIVTVTQIVATVIYSLTISWEMVLLCFLICGAMLVISNKNNQQIPFKMKKVGESFNKVYSVIWDHLHNAEVTSFLNKKRVFAHLEKTVIETSDNLVAVNKVQNVSRIFSRFASIMIVMITALYGGFMAINYGMKIANILALIIILQILADSIFKIPALVARLRGVQGEGQVLDKLYNLTSSYQKEFLHEVKEAPDCISAQFICYKPKDEISPISIVDSFTVKKGQIICIAGASGSGKTTFLHICAGLFPDYQGNLYWDKMDLAMINRKSLWDQITLVEQTAVCLPTTIKKNIILDDPSCDRKRLEQAIIDSGIKNYIDKLPLEIETEIAKNQLSSGEMQKLCLARAFYHNKPIILLDEATSALDPVAEKHVISTLQRRVLHKGLIVIAVTHRLNFLTQCNYVLYLEKNRPSMFGKHEELLTTSKNYHEMIRDRKDGRADD